VSERADRSPAEWVTFGVCSLVLAAVVALIAVQVRGPNEPPAPSAAVTSSPRQVGDSFQVEVTVTNDGDATAANVQVSAELVPAGGGAPTTGDQTIDFLAGHEEDDLVFVFPDDPSGGELTVGVTSFAVP
jgi:uncharacterized protein (TIGR02588 family)